MIFEAFLKIIHMIKCHGNDRVDVDDGLGRIKCLTTSDPDPHFLGWEEGGGRVKCSLSQFCVSWHGMSLLVVKYE